MDPADLASVGFVALSLGTLAFFCHQLAWMVRYRALLRQLIAADAERRDARLDEARRALGELEQRTWQQAVEALGGSVASLPGYVELVDRRLRALLEADRARPHFATELPKAVLAAAPVDTTALGIALPDGEQASARLQLEGRPLAEAEPPPEAAFELDLRSRYRFRRHALAFVTGFADVVYSSSHVARMTQHAHLPLGTIVRRMSLVVMLVVGIVLEVILGWRDGLAAWLAPRLGEATWAAQLPAALRDDVPGTVALAIWTVLVTGLYFALYFAVRRRAGKHLRELERLRKEQPERLAAIRRRQLEALGTWAAEQGRHLDVAVAAACRHLYLLARRDAQRLRLRLVGPALREATRRVNGALLLHLPEGGEDLRDRATSRKRSLRHRLWPRRQEMVDVVEQAACRQAWRRLELGASELGRGQPRPEAVEAFWRQLVEDAATLAELLPPGQLELMRRDYEEYARAIVRDTGADLVALGEAAGEVVWQLDAQLRAAASALEARHDLADQRIASDGAELLAEVVRTREAARLEAMAFEI